MQSPVLGEDTHAYELAFLDGPQGTEVWFDPVTPALADTISWTLSEADQDAELASLGGALVSPL